MRFNLLSKAALSVCMSLACGIAATANDNEEVNYRPNVHGTIRPRAEVLTGSGEARFQVRNARLSIDGQIAPNIDYFFNTDLCDRGSILILDVWARIHILRQLSVQTGQFRMPFGVEPFRAPHTYIFANRSFIGKQACNVRAVGVQLAYNFEHIPLSIAGGMFNANPIGNHETWSKDFAYAVKASYRVTNVTFTTGFQSIIPDGIRANLWDACVGWRAGRWQVEGEFMTKHYTQAAYKISNSYLGVESEEIKTTLAYSAYADYAMPIKAGRFNKLSFQGRFDGLTDHSNVKRDENGLLTINDPARNRVTIGSTISYVKSKNTFLDLRLNFEKYFYANDVVAPLGQDDKIIAEIVLRF